jgi:hypothetical protein
MDFKILIFYKILIVIISIIEILVRKYINTQKI